MSSPSGYDCLLKQTGIDDIIPFLYNSGQDEMLLKISNAIKEMKEAKKEADAVQAKKDKNYKNILKLVEQKNDMKKKALMSDSKLLNIHLTLLSASTLRGENDDLINEIINHLEESAY